MLSWCTKDGEFTDLTGEGSESPGWSLNEKVDRGDWFASGERTELVDACLWEWLGMTASVPAKTSWLAEFSDVWAPVGGGCGSGIAIPVATPASVTVGFVHCLSCHPVCSFPTSQLESRDFQLPHHHAIQTTIYPCLTWLTAYSQIFG